MSLYDALVILSRHKLILACAAVIGVAAGFPVFRALPETYATEGLLVLSPDAADGGDTSNSIPAEWRVATERDIITTRAMLEGALDRLDVPETYQLLSTVTPLTAAVRRVLGTGDAGQGPELLRAALLDDLGRRVTVSSGTDSFVLKISLKSADPRFAADFVNALMAEHIFEKDAQARADRTAVMEAVARERAAINYRLDSVIAELGELQSAANHEARREDLNQELQRLRALGQAVTSAAERIGFQSGDSATQVLSPAPVLQNGSSLPRLAVLSAILLSMVGLTTLVLLVRGTAPDVDRSTT